MRGKYKTFDTILNKPSTLLFYLDNAYVTARLGRFGKNDPPTGRTHPKHIVELFWVGAMPAKEI